MRAHTLMRVLAALAGIAVTAGLTWSVQRLAGQHIGLTSTPPTVIRGLAPPNEPRAPAASFPEPAGGGGRGVPGGGGRPAAGPQPSPAAPPVSTAPGAAPSSGGSPSGSPGGRSAHEGADAGERSGGRDD